MVKWCRAYNEMVADCQEEVAGLKAQQRKSMAKQMELDEQSLQRLKDQQASQQVRYDVVSAEWKIALQAAWLLLGQTGFVGCLDLQCMPFACK